MPACSPQDLAAAVGWSVEEVERMLRSPLDSSADGGMERGGGRRHRARGRRDRDVEEAVRWHGGGQVQRGARRAHVPVVLRTGDDEERGGRRLSAVLTCWGRGGAERED